MNVQRQDRFWIKSQPYSGHAGERRVRGQFVAGTVYQAFLSATNYHRWHTPVARTIVRATVQGGTYYSEADSEGADAVEPKKSQSYLAHVAARAIILIEADGPVIGLMACVPVGMSEVSSCVIGPDIQPGHRVVKSGELGYFHPAARRAVDRPRTRGSRPSLGGRLVPSAPEPERDSDLAREDVLAQLLLNAI
jgi:phosphatidylserine decarboxylase